MVQHEQEYDAKVLRRLQKMELGILKDFDALCKANGWRYFIAGGTAIGAIRHKGFIPWDDDIDVCMPREDYEAFLKAAESILPDRYQLFHMGMEKEYVLTFAKLTIRGTVFLEATNKERKYSSGIFIDVFPLDKTVDDRERRRKQIQKTWLYARLGVLSRYYNPQLPAGMVGWKRGLVRGVLFIAHVGMKVLGMSKERMYRNYLKWATMYNDQDCTIYADFSYPDPERILMPVRELFPVVRVPFEDITVDIYNGFDAILRRQYGDYMQLPPEGQRHNHLPYKLDFGVEEIVELATDELCE